MKIKSIKERVEGDAGGDITSITYLSLLANKDASV